MANVLHDNDIMLSRVEQSMNGQTAIMDLYYLVTGSAGLGITDLDFAKAVDLNFGAFMKSQGTVQSRYEGVRAARVTPGATPSFLYAINSGAGTLAVSNCPTQCCAVMRKDTGILGRKYRGRVYYPFIPVTWLTAAGTFNALASVEMAAFRTALIATLGAGTAPNTAGLIPVLYHRSNFSSTIISDFIFTVKVGTQRKRGDYGRPNLP